MTASNIRMDVTQDSNMNYFSRTILPAYQECALDTGLSSLSLRVRACHLLTYGQARV